MMGCYVHCTLSITEVTVALTGVGIMTLHKTHRLKLCNAEKKQAVVKYYKNIAKTLVMQSYSLLQFSCLYFTGHVDGFAQIGKSVTCIVLYVEKQDV